MRLAPEADYALLFLLLLLLLLPLYFLCACNPSPFRVSSTRCGTRVYGAAVARTRRTSSMASYQMKQLLMLDHAG
jgi:hypothetical protein